VASTRINGILEPLFNPYIGYVGSYYAIHAFSLVPTPS